MTNPLVPAAVEARGESRRRLPFGFGPRFFLALLVGLLWLIPAWWSARLGAAMFLWDGLVVGVWLFDLYRLPRPASLTLRRVWKTAPSLASPSTVYVEIANRGRRAIRVALVDEAPVSFCRQPPQLEAEVAAAGSVAREYTIVPGERGDARFGNVFIRYGAPFGFAQRWAVAPLAQTVRVTPDLTEARDQALYLIRSRQVEMEKRRRRHRGMGREFQSLREYRQGDDPRDICWPATARRHQLTTRIYEVERSQVVWLAVDAGRLLRAQVRPAGRPVPLAKLDYAVQAALSLAHVATQCGDRVGLLAYGRSIQQTLGAGRGPLHIRALVDALSLVRAEPNEANHGLAARWLLERQTRRALVVWITDFAETPATPEVIESASRTGRKHLVLFAAVSQPDLAALAAAIPQNEEEMFRHAAALEIVERRELLLRGLRQSGVLVAEQAPGLLTTSLVNHYLEIKDRGRL
jgi:uncharacterized protein (DUF58 family)